MAKSIAVWKRGHIMSTTVIDPVHRLEEETAGHSAP